MTSCTNCLGTSFKRATVELVRHVAGRVFAGQLPARVCLGCEMRYFAGDDLGRFDLAVAATLATAGVLDPEALRFMRKATEPRAKEFADLLGVRAETVSRWESGKTTIDRAAYAVIHQLIVDRLQGSSATSDYLRSLRKPRRLPARVKIVLPDAA